MARSNVLSTLRRTGVVAALLLGSSIFSNAYATGANPQQQQSPMQKVSAEGKLQVRQPRAVVRSWNGRRITVVTPTPTNTRFPTRGLDPMNVQLHDVHPDSEMEFLRQRQSHDVFPEKCSGNCDFKQLSEQAAHYVPMFSFKATPPSVAQAHNELVTDEKKVAWPNSRVLIKGKTRDGQQIPHVTAVVEGVQDMRTQPYDAASNAVVHELISGRLLPSARAWIKAGNLFVSEPTINKQQIKDGEKLIDEADAKDKLVAKKQADITAEQGNAQQQKPVDYQKIRQLQSDISTLQSQSQQERSQGQNLVTQGKKIKVQIISAAALPASAPVTTINTRVRGENQSGAIHTASSTSDAYDGYMAHEVEAIALDHLETSVSFAPQVGAALTSRATVKFQVPDHREKAVTTIDGVKYYRVKPTSIERHNDPVPQS
jgi:hypothetical protein